MPGAHVYLFEVLRQGSLGRVNVIREWPTEPVFRIPAKLEPGLYYWSASPEVRRGGLHRSTVFARAGRFRITESGEFRRLG